MSRARWFVEWRRVRLLTQYGAELLAHPVALRVLVERRA